ncbi:hypothetical protein [Cohnella silvisoli]|uniref:Uncharacterized protein n=1 Tax=Cohnella silvisoli TaxID=2873699 RepID=A0ABV1KYV5_9BACL|nr:hypothetical protein [Cohnella silvisoli]MCD9024377.1 hypothetical protein [Cohnella silvisoli]
MAAKKTIRKAVCNVCGEQANAWYVGGKHSCGGKYEAADVAKEVITGEFTFVRSYGNVVYLRHVETERDVKIYTVDLLKVLAGRTIGLLTLTESKRGDQPCWKAEEAAGA